MATLFTRFLCNRAANAASMLCKFNLTSVFYVFHKYFLVSANVGAYGLTVLRFNSTEAGKALPKVSCIKLMINPQENSSISSLKGVL